MKIIFMMTEPCPRCKKMMDVCYFIETKEKTSICLNCGYFKALAIERDDAVSIGTATPENRHIVVEITEPYGILHIEGTDTVYRYLPLKSKDEIFEIYKMVLENVGDIKSAKIHRFENGKFSVIDVLQLVKGVN